jgi:predicted 2-oxoglutarate/Fe(II)-dependent dioxygenase YbiX
MIKLSNNILDNKTYKKLKEICEDFDNRDLVIMEPNNFYIRLFIKNDILVDYLNNAKKYLIENLPINHTKMIDFEDTESWINKVSIETNKNDVFHTDESELTIVTYLNDEFTGGEFVYTDETKKTETIIPKSNMSLIMNNKLLHKVSAVNSGVRFSLVTFYKIKYKKNKTLI